MSEIQNLNILLKPDSNKNNKKIMDYLSINQKKINNNDMEIKPLIVESDKIDKFIKLGVSNLPTLLYDGEIIYGVNEIITFIDNKCNEKKESSKKDIIQENDEDVRDYMLMTAMEKDDDEKDKPVSGPDMRNNRFTKKNEPSKSNTSGENNKIYDDDDDDIMAMYWDNIETST